MRHAGLGRRDLVKAFGLGTAAWAASGCAGPAPAGGNGPSPRPVPPSGGSGARRLHVAVAQVRSRAGAPEENLERMLRQVRSAAAVGVEVILFAETVVHAFDLSPENVARAEPATGPIARRIAGWAAGHRIAILAGFFERDGDRTYNSQLVARPDGSVAVQRKHNLREDERRVLAPGPRERTVFEFNGIRTAVLICADVGIPGIGQDLARQGIAFRFIPTAGGGTLDEMLRESDLARPEGRAAYARDREKVFKADAILGEAECPTCGFASANALGFDGRNACHRGHCMIVDNRRVMRAQIPGTNVLEHQQDQMAHAELDFAG